jgi:predicted dehydrogenase
MLHLIQQPVERLYGEVVQSINSTREDMFNGLIRFRNGVQGVLNVNWMTPRKVRELTLTGARGMFHCNLLSQELFFYENETAPSQWDQLSLLRGVAEGNILGIRIQRKEPLRAELEDFAAAVNGGRLPLVSGRDGTETLRTALCFLESATRLQVVHPASGAAP